MQTRKYSSLAALIAGVVFLFGSSVNAQQPKFKVGDRVEFSENSACLGAQYAIPSKGTIIQVNTGTAMNYVVQVDPLPGKAPRIVSRADIHARVRFPRFGWRRAQNRD